jgi:hypothetical protein
MKITGFGLWVWVPVLDFWIEFWISHYEQYNFSFCHHKNAYTNNECSFLIT